MNSSIKIWRENKTKYQNLGKIGKIVAATKITTPVTGFTAFAPYWVAVIDLGKEKITSQLVDVPGIPKKNDQVIGVCRRLKQPDKTGVIEYGIKFKLISR